MLNIRFKRLSSIATLFRSIWFCVRYLPIHKAINIPIVVKSRIDVQLLRRGQIEVCNPVRYSIMLGGGGSPGLNSFKTTIRLGINAKIIFRGSATISEGTVLRVDEGNVLDIGNRFYCNKNNYFRCADNVTIGENCLLGWENIINTTDGHFVMHDGVDSCNHGEVSIGNHVWITTRCILGKSVLIPDNCIVAQGAVVQKSIEESNVLIGGIPAKVIKNNINWRH